MTSEPKPTSRQAADANAAKQFTQACEAASLDGRVSVNLVARVLWVRLERAEKHNALALDMLDAIGAVFTLAALQMSKDDDPDWLRLAVITGAGDQSFAAGGDLRELDQVRTRAQAEAMSARGMAALNAIRDFPQPVIAALNGTARGGGAELAMACDWRVAHEQAAIGFIQGRLNLSPAWGGGTDLLRCVSPASAQRVLAEAALIPAAQALALGLIELTLAPSAEGFEAALSRYVANLSERPAQVLRAQKALALGSLAAREHSQASETALLVQTWTHDDHWQAAAQALKK